MKQLGLLFLLLTLTGCAGYHHYGPPHPGDGVVTLIHQRTGERATIVYREAGFILPDAMKKIDYLMRDNANNMTVKMDPNLIILLDDLTGAMGLPGDVPIIICSGYRSPWTNNDLHKQSPQVAENSYHLLGRAADIKIPGVSGTDIYEAAKALHRGGYAYYPRSGHVHVDTGPPRTWSTY